MIVPTNSSQNRHSKDEYGWPRRIPRDRRLALARGVNSRLSVARNRRYGCRTPGVIASEVDPSTRINATAASNSLHPQGLAQSA